MEESVTLENRTKMKYGIPGLVLNVNDYPSQTINVLCAPGKIH